METAIEPKLNEYANSRPLYINYWSRAKQVNSLIDCLAEEIGYKNLTQKTHLKVTLLNLFVNYKADKTRYVGFSRDPHQNILPRSRYNRLGIAAESLSEIVDALVREDYITYKEGWEDIRTGMRYRSKMRATEKLAEMFKQHEWETSQVGKFAEDELVIVREVLDDGYKYIDYKDSRKADDLRRFLKRYNELLFRTYIDVDDYEYKSNSELIVDLTSKRVRRIYHDDKFKTGGRFYGGWWQNIPEDLRARIIIERFYTVEYDYSGYHIYLLYAKEGINFRDLNKEPYVYPKGNDPHKLRSIYKHLLLCAINAEDRTQCLRATRTEINKGRNKNPDKYPDVIPDLGKQLDIFKEYHKPIADYIHKGVGLDLQNIDSKIAEYVLRDMTDNGLPCLCVHDSFICRIIDGHYLRELMRYAYIKHLPGDPWRGLMHKVLESEIDITESNIQSNKEPHQQEDDNLYNILSRSEAGLYKREMNYLRTENPSIDKIIKIPRAVTKEE